MMLVALAASSIAALALGREHGREQPALLVSGALVAAGVFACLRLSGTLAARLCLAVACAVSVGLQLHLGQGAPELQAGMFVLLALLLAYQDWRPIVLTAGLLVLHHLSFASLHRLWWPDGTDGTAPDTMGRAHLAYLLLQAALETWVTVSMPRLATRPASASAWPDSGESFPGSIGDTVPVTLPDDIDDPNPSQTIRRPDGDAVKRRPELLPLAAMTQAPAVGQVHAGRHLGARGATQRGAAPPMPANAAHELPIDELGHTLQQADLAAGRVSDIAAVADNLAFRTSLAALHAAIEAARSGEQGKHFAQLAREVRALANRTTSTAQDIRSLLDRSAGQVDASARLVADAGSAMAQIRMAAQRVGEAATLLGNVPQDPSAGIGQLGHAVQALEELAQRHGDLIGHSSETADALHQLAQRMRELLASFKPDEAAGAG